MFLQQFINNARISTALAEFHNLTDQETDSFAFTTLEVFYRLRIIGNNLFYNFFDSTGIGNLNKALLISSIIAAN